MKKLFLSLIFTLIVFSIFSEDMYLSGRVSFLEAQFWERQVNKYDENLNRKVMSNTNGGSTGLGFEWVIWDIGKKRGSRIFLLSELDFVIIALNYIGWFEDKIKVGNLNGIDINNGALYLGFDYSVYFGGTFPKLDLKWGLGSNFFYMFTTYSSIQNNNVEIFKFFATPSIFLAYDFFVQTYTKTKITPMIKTGITTVPLIPYQFINDISSYKLEPQNWYSGIFIEVSLSVSFFTYQWRK